MKLLTGARYSIMFELSFNSECNWEELKEALPEVKYLRQNIYFLRRDKLLKGLKVTKKGEKIFKRTQEFYQKGY